MLLIEFLVLIRHEGQVELALPQVIGLGAVPQPGKLQLEVGAAVPQVDQLEGAVGGVLHPHRLQAQGLLVEGQAPVQVQDIKIKMVELNHGSVLLLMGWRRIFRPRARNPGRFYYTVPLRRIATESSQPSSG